MRRTELAADALPGAVRPADQERVSLRRYTYSPSSRPDGECLASVWRAFQEGGVFARPKTVKTIVGDVTVEVPRDRNGTFVPTLVKPYQRRLTGFDDIVVSLDGKGLTTGEIRSRLAEIYDTEVLAELISEITDRVLANYQTWHNRPPRAPTE